MTPITPNELSEKEFSKSLRGYTPAEVDEYIRRLLENYTLLYRENVELAKQLSEALKKLDILSEERTLSKLTLQNAKTKGDKIIEDAYIKADDILASVKTSCDSIIRNFRDKAAAEKKALADIQQTLLTFKHELFEKYRLHIELIEQLSPIYETEDLSPDEYVQRIVTEWKREVDAQYGISLDNIEIPEPLKEPKPKKEPLPAEVTEETPAEPKEPKKKTTRKPRSTKKKTDKPKPSVMALINEYEDPTVLRESKFVPEQQFMLNFDEPSEAGILSKEES